VLLRTPEGIYRPICDFRGSVLALLDESGDIAESYRYDLPAVSAPTAQPQALQAGGFGRARVFDGDGTEIAASAVGNPFGFACKRYDGTTALYHFGARWYDPAPGRFISPDPLGFVDGPSRYAYCAGDPVNYVDPWGLCADGGFTRVEPQFGPFIYYYPNRPTWYDEPIWGVRNSLAFGWNGVLGSGDALSGLNQWARYRWDWYDEALDWLGSDEAVALGVILPQAGLANAWRNAGYLAESGSALARAGWARWLPRVGTPASVVPDYAQGSFSVWDWGGYPEGMPRPEGPLRLLEGQEYESARQAATRANRAMHAADPSLAGKHMHEIRPVKFGGSPTDPANKIPLARPRHTQITNWWNRLMRDLTRDRAAGG